MWSPYPEIIKTLEPGDLQLTVSRPAHHQVVMGAAGKPEHEVNGAVLTEMRIPLYKRKGGGGTVLLGPETIVVTLHAGVAHAFRNLAYFTAINLALISVLRHWRPLPFEQRGFSDIALADRKLVGSSIYRRKHYLLYQASILVDLNIDLISRLLKHPPREPDYRAGRPHQAFLTCLRELGITTEEAQLQADLRDYLPTAARTELDRIDGNPNA